MAVPKRRVPVPEDATEFWKWAEQQTSLSASLVFVVKEYIARHGDGDAICAFSFDSDERKERKPRAKRSEADKLERTERQMFTAKPVEKQATEQKAPVQTAEVTITSNHATEYTQKPVVQPVATPTPVTEPETSSDDILSQLTGNSNSNIESTDNNDAADAMLASMLNI